MYTMISRLFLLLIIAVYSLNAAQLSKKDFENAKSVRITPADDFLPDQASNQFLGDINLDGRTPLYWGLIDLDDPDADKIDPSVSTKNAIRNRRKLWTNGVIPYEISSRFSSSQRANLARAIIEIRKRTCIKLEPRSRERDYVYFDRKDGCWSYIGKTGGRQIISIGVGCDSVGTIVHEIMHAIGFLHEQARADRDNYVTVHYNNIEEDSASQFKRYSLSTIDHLGTKYDLTSVMHYPEHAFSKNGKPTITPKRGSIRNSGTLSSNDVVKINRLYRCDDKSEEKPNKPTKTSTRTCSDKKSSCKSWGRRGYCTKSSYKKYMQKNCCSTCGNTDGSDECRDTTSLCSGFKRSGYCTRGLLKAVMKKRCCKTCQLG